MSLGKYKGEQSFEDHSAPLHWSKNLPLPFRANRPVNLFPNELEQQVQVVSDFHAETFDLRDPKQKEQYLKVRERIESNWYKLIYERRVPDSFDQLDRFVTLEWTQRYCQQVPTDNVDAVKEHTDVNSSIANFNATDSSDEEDLVPLNGHQPIDF